MRSLKLLPRPQIFATLLFRDTTNRYFPASVCIFNSLRIIFVLHKFSSDSCCLAQEDSHYKANRKASKLRIKVRLLLYPGSKILTNTHPGLLLLLPFFPVGSSTHAHCGQGWHGKFTHIISTATSPFSSSSFQTISGRVFIPLLSTLSSLLSSILGPKRILIIAANHLHLQQETGSLRILK